MNKKGGFYFQIFRNIAKYNIYKYLYTDEALIRRKFRKILKRDLELNNPINYNDKIQWLKLYWRDEKAAICADKYLVRDYVKNKIGDEYLNTLYGVYERTEDIELDELPNTFVLKATHGSGWNILCFDKEKMNWNNEIKKMDKWLKTNFFWMTREWVYKDLHPRIICEKNISDAQGVPPKDYKIFCFHGKPKIIQVDSNRFSEHVQNFYDVNWNLLDIEFTNKDEEQINRKKPSITQPQELDKMLELSEKLSEDFAHVRVDFYLQDEKIVFGELTFFPHNGLGKFYPKEFEETMGNWINLPKASSK